ncbi:MAG: S-layer homology domain-containing protein [Timaviella obliquedivisa GSE-PSE-MK23-08B]|jgi:hypothetical protein|nr:S-layer homology domain-containing protein [Timaviella obliquedivisa GSE-PSE-MK23-08B]
MIYLSQRSITLGLVTTTSITVGAIAALTLPISTSVAAPTTLRFSDTQGYWAQPFIQPLAEQNIVSGYPDGTFRPNQPMGRDEFAAIIRDAFDREDEQQLADGSVYKDVPEGYWAAPAIEEAYEMGFVQGYPDGSFRPQQPVTKASAISSLAQNLDLQASTPDVQPVAAVLSSPDQAMPSPVSNQAARPQAPKRRALMYPIAMTMLMQPLVNRPAQASPAPDSSQAIAQPVENSPAQTQQPTKQSPSVSEYYVDADQIPQEVVGDIAAATQAGIVVNYPDPKVLNPNQPATRGEVAAWVHQALVTKGRITPLANNPATAYVINPR